jgi:hypothetical protein
VADPVPLKDLEDAELAYNRVRAELEAINPDDLKPMNVDVVSATSIALGSAPRILGYRERMAKLEEFNIRHVDNLTDYAKAAWYVYVTQLPVPEPADAQALIDEVVALRAKLLMWAAPLIGAGKFDEGAVNRIREGSGMKDAPSDVVALVVLYRSNWEGVSSICGVTEADLARGAEIGPAVFALVSRRENQLTGTVSDGSLRVRRAWTLLDRAYDQCRRALTFLRHDDNDADSIAPSMRRNAGGRPPAQGAQPPAPTPAPAPPVTAPGAPVVGGGGGPFSSTPQS